MSQPQLNCNNWMTHFHGLLIGLRRFAPPANGGRLSGFVFFAFFVLAFAVLGGCTRPSEPGRLVAVTQQVGAWSGRGSMTVGDVNSETGRLRITWQTTNEAPVGTGSFKLTLRSGVSGRTIAVVADHRGAGTGTVETDEGPRTYDFLVESANVDWKFSVEETSGTPGPAKR